MRGWRFATIPMVSGLLLWIFLLPAAADPVYLPLGLGTTWSYETPARDAETMTVTGTIDLLSSTVTVIEYSESTANDSLENYWTTESDGDVLLWGFFRAESGGWGYAYDPPVRVVDAPLYVGKTWTIESQVLSLPGGAPTGTLSGELTVSWEGELTVPAGDFECFAIESVDTLPPPRLPVDVRIDGRETGSSFYPTEWFSDGVGRVQYDSDTLYELVSYLASPVERTSWSTIKTLFR
jgi:hypothetical protein